MLLPHLCECGLTKIGAGGSSIVSSTHFAFTHAFCVSVCVSDYTRCVRMCVCVKQLFYDFFLLFEKNLAWVRRWQTGNSSKWGQKRGKTSKLLRFFPFSCFRLNGFVYMWAFFPLHLLIFDVFANKTCFLFTLWTR